MTDQFDATPTSDGFPPSPGREALVRLFVECGFDNTGVNPHSWRCEWYAKTAAENPEKALDLYCTCPQDMADALLKAGWNNDATGIQPGDIVEPRERELDPREVVSVGEDFLTLRIFDIETQRLPKDNYAVVKRRGQW